MDCRDFTSRHAAFIDDTLPGVEMAVMREHLDRCARCARRDADVRRALLLLKNLPPLSVSGEFQHRLRERLAREDAIGAPVPTRLTTRFPSRWIASAAAIVAIAGVARWTIASGGPAPAPSRLPAVTASTPPHQGEDPAPADLASMSTGVSMWPALMLAEEGPLRFAATELQNASWDASKPNH